MRVRRMFELEGENKIEEQYLLNKFPDAIWITLGSKTKFYVPEGMRDIVFEATRELLAREINEHDGLKTVVEKVQMESDDG